MEHIEGAASTRETIKMKLREQFDGKIVRKDLTKKIKEGANVPVYVLEFLRSSRRALTGLNGFSRITLCVRMKTRRFCLCSASAVPIL